MLKGLTNKFKNNCNNIEVIYKEYLILDGVTIPIKAKLEDDCYENGNFIGTFIFKTIQFETNADYNFKNKEFEYYKEVDGESIKIGTFITTEIQLNDTTNIVKVIGMDFGLKTQVEYTSELNYSSGTITLLDVWNEACTLSGLTSGISTFVNDDFIVDGDQFSGTGATIRDVFKAIAMSSGTFVKVMNDDKIYLIFTETTTDVIEDYTELNDKRDTHPWTCLRLGVSQVDGENLDYFDEELVEEYGENWLILNDNPFAYNQSKRQALIENIYNQIKLFGYSAFESKTSFKPYLTCGDKIQFRNRNGDLVNSIILRCIQNYENITLSAPSETSATINYVYPLSAVQIAKNTQIEVDKANNRIQLINEEYLDFLKHTTGSPYVTLTDCKANGLLYLKITGDWYSKIYPSETGLYPMATGLYPIEIKLVFENVNTHEKEYYTLDCDFQDIDDKFEYFYEYDEDVKDYVAKAIFTDHYGTETEITAPQFNFGDGTYKIYLNNMFYVIATATIEANYVIQNDLTGVVATNTQLSTAITTTRNEIDLKTSALVNKSEIIADINLAIQNGQGIITLTGNQVVINSDNFKVTGEGNITATSGEIGGFTLGKEQFLSLAHGLYQYDEYDILMCQAYISNLIQTTTSIFNIYDYNETGTINALDLLQIKKILMGLIDNTKEANGRLEINTKNPKNNLIIYSEYDEPIVTMGVSGIHSENITGRNLILGNPYSSADDSTKIIASGDTGIINCISVVQSSLENKKKNIEKLDNALDIINNIDIYKYNFNDENDNTKKHIGFVIGDNYNYSKEVTSNKNDGVDIYSFVGVCCKAIQEQQKIIEDLQAKIQELEDKK